MTDDDRFYESPCNATALRKAARFVSQFYDQALAPSGLKSTQRSILMQIARTRDVGVGELAELLVLDRTAMTHNLKPLVRDGLVTIGTSPTDKRARVVALTAAGVDKLGHSERLWQAAQDRFEAAYGRSSSLELRRNLGRVVALDLAIMP